MITKKYEFFILLYAYGTVNSTNNSDGSYFIMSYSIWEPILWPTSFKVNSLALKQPWIISVNTTLSSLSPRKPNDIVTTREHTTQGYAYLLSSIQNTRYLLQVMLNLLLRDLDATGQFRCTRASVYVTRSSKMRATSPNSRTSAASRRGPLAR